MTARTRKTAPKPTTEPANPFGKLAKAPAPPEYLSDGGRAEWLRIAPATAALGTLAGCDLRALALCCEALAQEGILRETIGREGFTIAAGSGGSKAHPAVRLLAETRTQAAALLAHFGLTPRGRGQLRVSAPVVEEESPLAVLMAMRSKRA